MNEARRQKRLLARSTHKLRKHKAGLVTPDFDENRVWTVIVGVCQGKDNNAIYNSLEDRDRGVLVQKPDEPAQLIEKVRDYYQREFPDE